MLSTTLRCACGAKLLYPKFTIYKSSVSSSSPPSSQYRQWSGLQQWRESPINRNRRWGPGGPQPEPMTAAEYEFTEADEMDFKAVGSAGTLAELGFLVLSTSDPLTKSKVSHFAFSRWQREMLPVGVFDPPAWPARPAKPKLVSPKEIPPPKHSGLPLNAYMLHNLAHVELNAIDLAWDTVVRFSPYCEVLGKGFFADFARIADDESRHFAWCSQRLSELGFSYGDMPAHNLLWGECEKSSNNVVGRLAAIPLVQEARGLDAGPRLVKKLVGFGDHRTSNIVERIADEEVAHVAVGVHWFVSLCEKMGCVPSSTFKDLLKEYNVEVRGPFNHLAREEAGLPRHWYDESAVVETSEKQQLSEVHKRLAHYIAMENENASESTPVG